MPDRGPTGRPVVVVGAGVGGLAAAIRLAGKGVPALVLEKETQPGGKMRALDVGGRDIDAGPTVFTMRWVFDELLRPAGVALEDVVALDAADILARHAWPDGASFDLHADVAASASAVRALSGAREADGFRRFAADSAQTFATLKDSFIAAERTTPIGLAGRVGLGNVGRLRALRPFTTLWRALGDYFRDPRLRQLFGRYATYCGSSPFEAPATLMLVAHVEQTGVWLPRGGMHGFAKGLARTLEHVGGEIVAGARVAAVETTGANHTIRLDDGSAIPAAAVVFNGDAAALAPLLAGGTDAGVTPTPRRDRSLSAMVWTLLARPAGFPLARHTVFFSDDYAGEFDAIFRRGRVPDRPTVYVCAQDRDDRGARNDAGDGPERLLCLVNAPANGDVHAYPDSEVDRCFNAMLTQVDAMGLKLGANGLPSQATTPAGFHRLFPGTGGALYGPASHGWGASFSRPGATTRIPGLFLAGGSVHPGPGVPMAALSGMLAADRAAAYLASTR